MVTSISLVRRPLAHYEIGRVSLWQPLQWLRLGLQDLRACPAPSLAQGGLVVAMGSVLLAVCDAHLYLIVAAVTGYLLIGPVMTTGLCELSRRRAADEPLGFDEALSAFGRNPAPFAAFGVVLAALSLGWLLASQLTFGSLLAPSGLHLNWNILLWGSFTGALSGGELIAYFSSGAALALVVFSLSVVAVPLLIERRASVVDAMWTGLRVVRANAPAMAVWALAIAALTALGFLTMLIGLIVIIPVLGHATWHAYRELVH